MESSLRISKTSWIALLTLSLAPGLLGFYLSYQDEQTRFSEMCSVAESHLIYALQLKDDMALIDWSKRLEKLPSVLAFQAHSGSKIIAMGGNQEMCPIVSNNGLSFDVPYRWIVHSTFNKENAVSSDLTMVFQDSHGPFLWASFLFLVSFLTGVTLSLLKVTPKTEQTTEVSSTSLVETSKTAPPMIPGMDEKSLTLALDADYMICHISPLAAKELNRSVSDLVGNHFLDLLPDPSLMRLIAEAKEIKFLKAFPSSPHLSASIRPVPDGTILVLKNEQGSEKPGNGPI